MSSRADLYRHRMANPLAVQRSLERLPLDASTVGLWLFNQGSGTTVNDLSPTGRNITLEGSPAWLTGDMRFSPTLSFDGVNDAGQFTGASLFSLNSCSIEAVVRSSVASFSGEDPIYTEGTTSTVRFRFGRVNNAFFFGWLNTAATVWYDKSSTFNPVWTQWNYLVATKAGNTQSLYINGVSAGAVEAPGGPIQTPTVTYICKYPDPGFWTTMELAGLRISNTVRSAEEILVRARIMGFA